MGYGQALESYPTDSEEEAELLCPSHRQSRRGPASAVTAYDRGAAPRRQEKPTKWTEFGLPKST
jgi:hypothetical protein